MITCEFFGGRLAEVMQTIASLFHVAYFKNIPTENIVLPLLYKGSDFNNVKSDVILENYPIFKKIHKNFKLKIDLSDFVEYDLSKNWSEYYVNGDYSKNVILKNHWFDFIYNTNIYKILYKYDELWNCVYNKYKHCFNRDTLAIHIRRGDFVLINNNKDAYKEYYDGRTLLTLELIHDVVLNTKNKNILIFSDDIEWCKNNIKNDKNIYFIEGNKPYIDMVLMSMCDNILKTPGSTFSKMACSLK